MIRGDYFDSLKPETKFEFGRNLVLAGICGVFLPLIPGLLCILIGIGLIFPSFFNQAKRLFASAPQSLDHQERV
jgi:hypothetical protein